MTDSASPPRAWVNFAKGAAILLVLIYHVSLYLQAAGVVGIPNRLKAALELFPMPAFFLLAGLFSARSLTWNFPQLWKRKVWPLFYLYLVWSVVRFVFYVIVPGLNGDLGALPASSPIALALVVLWPSSSYWFIYAFALFTIAAWLLRKLPGPVHLALAAVLSTAFTTGLLNTPNLGWNRVGALYVFYVAGVLYAKPVFAALEKRTFPLIRLGAIGGAFLAVGAALLWLPIRSVPFLVLLGQALAVALGFVASVYLARVRPLQFISRLGAQSLQIYLLHLFIIVPVAALIRAASIEAPRLIDALIQLALTVVATVGSLYLARYTSRLRWLYVPRPLRRRPRLHTPQVRPAYEVK